MLSAGWLGTRLVVTIIAVSLSKKSSSCSRFSFYIARTRREMVRNRNWITVSSVVQYMKHHTHVGFFIMIGCDDRRVVVIDSIRGVVVLVLKRDLVALIPTRISSVPDT
jgi:hypothetical protein